MVNVGLSASSFVGIALAVAGAALYFLRSVRPKLARDHDIFFAAVGLLCGGILFFQGWRQDPILQFGQFMLTGTAVFFAVESIRLRSVATEQAKRSGNAPIVDDERPVSRVYRAELDEFDASDDRLDSRRIRSSRGRDDYRDEYEDSPRRRPRATEPRLPDSERLRRSRRSYDNDVTASRDQIDNLLDDIDQQERQVRGRISPSSEGYPGDRPSRRSDDSRSRRDASSSEYLDYRPIDSNKTDDWS